MTQQIQFDGQIHQFPDDFSQGDIQSALGSYSGNQPASQTPTNGQQPMPTNSAQLGNNQVNPLQGLSDWANSPTNVDLSNLPQSGEGLNFAQKLGFGAQALGKGLVGAGEDIVVKPAVRGITGLMSRANGNLPPNTDSGPNPNTLSTDEMSALAMMSPTSSALQSKMGFGAGNQSEPIGNQLINYTSRPTEIGDAEDAAYNALGPSPNVADQGSTLMAGLKARSPDELGLASDAMKSSAGDIYNKMNDVGAVLKPDAAQNLSGELDAALNKKTFIPELNPKTVAVVNKIKSTIDQNGQLGLGELDQYRRLLGRIGPTEDGVSAGDVRKAIDNFTVNTADSDWSTGTKEAVDLLQKGRQAYSTASRFEDVADVISKANGDPNRIKQGLTNFLKNDNNTRGWNQDQINAVRFAANTGVGENILKAFGKFGFDFSKSGTGNTVLPALASIAGGSGAAPMGIPLAVGGTLARQAQKYLARGKAEQALKFLQDAQ